MKKQTTILAVLFVLISGIAEAQFYGGGIYMRPRVYRRYPPRRPMQRREQQRPAYKPTVNFSVGYGYPNLDKNYFPDQFLSYNGSLNAYKGNTFAQTGPVTAALDFQFSRYSSIGVMGTYGKASVPYYDGNSTLENSSVLFTGNMKSYSVMLNMMTYFPSYQTVSPYIRTAVGISSRNENYLYPDGSKAIVGDNSNIQDIAYQVSIGTRFNLSPNAGFYIEAGYGRYIVNGGLTFRF